MWKYIWLLLLLSQHTFAQLKTYTFRQIDTLAIDKPIVVFIHTNWCKSCISMQESTFENATVVEELNANYYYIPLNAESRKTIRFENKMYTYKTINKRRGVHELAEFLGGHLNRIKYPTTVVLNQKKEVVHKHASKLKAKGFLRLLRDIHKYEEL